MEFRQIQTFIRLAQCRSFSGTALELGYSQSAVTVQIKRLEEELGVRLFDRLGKQVALTHQGESFLVHANKVVRELSQAAENLKTQGRLSGSLKIGTLESLCYAKMPAVLKYFYHNHPDVQVQLTTGSPEELLDMMNHGQVDLVYVLDKPLYHVNWGKALELEEEIVFVTAGNSSLVNGEMKSLADISGETFILTEREANYRKELDWALAELDRRIEPFLEISNPEFIIKLVKEGMGLSFLPWFSVEEEVKSGSLSVLRLSDFHLSMWRQVLYHKDKWMTPEMKEFIRLQTEHSLDIV